MFDQQPLQPAPSSGAVWSERQRSVFREKRDLDERILTISADFSAAAISDLDAGERDLLHRQLIAMQAYSDILKERLAAFASA